MTDVLSNVPARPRGDARPRRQRAAALALRAGLALGAVLLLAALFGRLMDFGIRRDEMLFVAPAALLGQSRLYVDFFYNHMPYSAWLFRGAAVLPLDFGLLEAARLSVFGGWLLLLGAVAWGVGRISGSWPLAAFSAVALVTHETFLGQTGMAASNNLFPLSFLAAGLALFLVEVVTRRTRALPLFTAGLCLSVAVGMKISAVVVIPPMVLAAFFLPRSLSPSQRFWLVVVPALAGGLLGAAPMIWLLSVHEQTLMAHVVGFHTGPHVAYWEAFQHTEPTLAMGVRDKLLLAYGTWLAGSALLLAIATLSAAWMAMSGTFHRVQWGAVILLLAILAVTVAMSFVPTPGFPQYYAAPVVVLPFLAALFVRPLGAQASSGLLPMLIAGVALMIFLALPRLAPGLLSLTDLRDAEASRFAQGGAEMRAALEAAGAPAGPVATLMPLYPLEAGLPVYPELATGQFLYRAGPFVDDALAAHYVGVGPDGIAALFAQTPPAALLLGYEPALEEPMRAFAEANGYRPVETRFLDNRYGEGVLYLPAGGEAQ